MPMEREMPGREHYSSKKAASAIEPVKPAAEEGDGEETGLQEAQRELNDLIARESRIPLPKAPKKTADLSLKLTPLDPARSKVQIASLPSRAMAEKEMRRLKANYGHLFGNRPWDIQKINLGPNRGTTYRLVVGSFNNRGNAVKFCSKLRGEGIGCMVVAPVGG
jgi:cell division septation protein DedD